MPTSAPVSIVSLTRRVMALAAAIVLGPVPLFAEARLVRVIWDVGQRHAYVKTEQVLAAGHDAFVLPEDRAAAERVGFVAIGTAPPLRKGDRVRIYAVNYNPVSHSWHESSSTVEQIAREPSLVGPLLNAALLSIAGAGKFPSTVVAFGPGPDLDQPCVSEKLRDGLTDLRKKARALYEAADAVAKTANGKGLRAAARKVAGVPTHAAVSSRFDNQEAWRAIVDPAAGAVGFDFETELGQLPKDLKAANERLAEVNAALSSFDAALLDLSIEESCAAPFEQVLQARDNVVTLINQVSGEGSLLQQTAALFQTTSSLWDTFKGRLRDGNWRRDVVELVVKEPVKNDVILRVDAVFVSPDKTFTERWHRTVVLEVEPFHPVLSISTGVGFHGLDFKQLQLVKVVDTASDGTVTVRNKLELVDDTTWEPIVPVWLQSVRIYARNGMGLYGTFGTTPDRNIFRNGIAGASLFVVRWRTVFTGGMIAARGYEEEDLSPVIVEYSDNGFARPDVTATNLKLPGKSWTRSWFASVTFSLVGF